MTDLQPPMRVEEAAALLGISPTGLRTLTAGPNPVSHIRIGKRISFTPEQVAEIRERFTVRPERAPARSAPVVQIQTRNARGPQRKAG